MTASRILKSLLVLACVAVDFAIAASHPVYPNTMACVLWGVTLGQIAVLAAWFIFGGLTFAIGSATSLACCGLASYVMSQASQPDFPQWLCFYGMFFCTTSSCFLISRAVRLYGRDDDADSDDLPVQFSIQWLLALTTSAALMLGWFKWMSFPWPNADEILALCGGYSAIALSWTWLLSLAWASGSRGPVRRAVIFGLAVLLVGMWVQDLGLPIRSHLVTCSALCAMIVVGWNVQRIASECDCDDRRTDKLTQSKSCVLVRLHDVDQPALP